VLPPGHSADGLEWAQVAAQTCCLWSRMGPAFLQSWSPIPLPLCLWLLGLAVLLVALASAACEPLELLPLIPDPRYLAISATFAGPAALTNVKLPHPHLFINIAWAGHITGCGSFDSIWLIRTITLLNRSKISSVVHSLGRPSSFANLGAPATCLLP